ncbi:hypothetical protein C7424_0286 [Pantoea ananatis]|nr:hypothetical protein C7424_0286 [Pantoea ananatis]
MIHDGAVAKRGAQEIFSEVRRRHYQEYSRAAKGLLFSPEYTKSLRKGAGREAKTADAESTLSVGRRQRSESVAEFRQFVFGQAGHFNHGRAIKAVI